MSDNRKDLSQKSLTVIMPVYNEEAYIVPVVQSWHAMLTNLKIDFRIVALNDGSSDNTLQILQSMAQLPELVIVDKPNSGHGPTILAGYARAISEAEWIFQVDSDDEMPPDDFPAFWAQRGAADFLFGVRAGRKQNLGRRLISLVSLMVVRGAGAAAVRDVNVPFRLMRRECLAAILPCIPAATFAPNLIIAGLASRGGCRIVNIPVTCRPRKSDSVSLGGLRVWKAAARAFGQTCMILWRHRRFRCGS